MPKNYTYTDAGVNRQQRHESKKALTALKETYRHIGFGGIMHLPYSNIFSVGDNVFLDLEIEGVGTKVLVAELAGKYDTIGVDAVAMVVNDVIRSGAKPLALADNIHATASKPELVNAWLKGIIDGANQSECPIVNGETGDVAEIIKGLTPNSGFDMVASAIGKVDKPRHHHGRRNQTRRPHHRISQQRRPQQRHHFGKKGSLQTMGRKIQSDRHPRRLG